ncbi:MAG: response regulator [Opitutales bacterium]|nr:response regulator [Opitutales bacterium]
MKSLIVEDDFTSSLLLQEILKQIGPVDVASNGVEAVAAAAKAVESGEPYTLICLDIMMPDMDGIEALKRIREIEDQHSIALGSGSSILMTTSLSDTGSITQAYKNLCDAYITKPIDQAQLHEALRNLNLIL